jgi:hypothetical protein
MRVHVDRIEGERAVLVLPDGRETVTLPARLLPDGTREGAALDLALMPALDDATAGKVEGLMDDVFGAPEDPK